MYLGIEIGGTKLQLGVGSDGSSLATLRELEIEPARGAIGILRQIERAGAELVSQYSIDRVGVGFGGPVDMTTGRVLRSHQIDGWEDLELSRWCEAILGAPTVVGNDCDLATLAEYLYGAGRGCHTVFYVKVGTGVGGGLMIDGQIHGIGRPAAAEIGQLRPGLQANSPDATVDSIASGWGIAAAARARINGDITLPIERTTRDATGNDDPPRLRIKSQEDIDDEFKLDLLDRVKGDLDQLTGKIVAQAAEEGNLLARETLRHATSVLGWAIAQTITLLAPDIVVLGGGVSQIHQSMFLEPIREAVRQYVFPPLQEASPVVPAELGKAVVVHGAIALAILTGDPNAD